MRCPECDEVVAGARVRFCGRCGARTIVEAAASTGRGPRARARPVSPRLRRTALAVLLALGVVTAAVATVTRRPADASHAVALGGPGNAGSYPGPGVPTPDLVGTRRVPVEGGVPPALPALGPDHVHVAAAGGLHALDPRTGEVRWRSPTAGNGTAPVAAGDVVVTAGGEEVTALATTDGSPRWRWSSGGVVASLAAGGDVVVAGVRRPGVDAVVGLGAADGALRWEYRVPPTAGRLSGPLWVGADTVLAIAALPQPEGPVGTVVALDARTGRERWAGPGLGGLAVAGGTVVVEQFVQFGTVASGVDLATGRQRWRTRPFVGAGGGIAVGDRVVLSLGDAVVALAVSDGSERWRVDTHGVALAAGDGLLVVSDGRATRALDPRTGTILWEAPLAGHAAVAGRDAVYVAAPSGIVALDPVSGRQRWTFSGTDLGRCVAGASRTEVVVAAATGVFGFELHTGRSWTFDVTPPAETHAGYATVSGDLLVTVDGVGQRSTRVAAVDLSTRRRRWQAVVEGAGVVGRPAADDRTVLVPVVGEEGTVVHALDAATGGRRWRSTLTAGSGEAVAVGAGVAVTTGPRGGVTALDTRTGAGRWRAAVRSGVAPAVTDAVVAVASGSAVVLLDLVEGEVAWRHDAGEEVAAVAVDDEAVVATTAGRLVALSPDTGEVRWDAPLSAATGAGVSVAGGVVHVATVAGLETFSLRDGRPLSSVITPRLVTSPPVVAAGRVIACLAGGTLAIYE